MLLGALERPICFLVDGPRLNSGRWSWLPLTTKFVKLGSLCLRCTVSGLWVLGWGSRFEFRAGVGTLIQIRGS